MKKKKRKIKGYVISNKMNKTLIVVIYRLVKHKIYGKYIKKKSKIYVHDNYNKCNIGDFIEIKECCPFSRNKSWKLSKIIKKIN